MARSGLLLESSTSIDRLASHGIERRSFLKYRAAPAGVPALLPRPVPRMVKALQWVQTAR